MRKIAAYILISAMTVSSPCVVYAAETGQAVETDLSESGQGGNGDTSMENTTSSILSGQSIDSVFQDMKECMQNGQEVSFAASMKKVGGLTISAEPQFNLSDTGIDMDNLDSSLTNFGFSQLSASLAGNYNNIDLSGKASGCTELFKKNYGELSEELALKDVSLPDEITDFSLSSAEIPDGFAQGLDNVSIPDGFAQGLDNVSIPENFNPETMLADSKASLQTAYAGVIGSSSFQQAKNMVSIGNIFQQAQNGVATYAPASIESLQASLGITNDAKIRYEEKKEYLGNTLAEQQARADFKQTVSAMQNKAEIDSLYDEYNETIADKAGDAAESAGTALIEAGKTTYVTEKSKSLRPSTSINNILMNAANGINAALLK